MHNLILEDRKKLSLTCVSDVKSFSDECVILVLGDTTLTVKGSELHISCLSVETGDVVIDGDVDSLAYSAAPKNDDGFFKRLLR